MLCNIMYNMLCCNILCYVILHFTILYHIPEARSLRRLVLAMIEQTKSVLLIICKLMLNVSTSVYLKCHGPAEGARPSSSYMCIHVCLNITNL